MAKDTKRPARPDPTSSGLTNPGMVGRTAATRKPTTVTVKSPRTINEAMIRERAYQIYLKRGRGPGNPVSDWAQAERELRAELGQ
jgi:hypothetical protein